MTKSNITQYDNTAANNTDVEDVPLGENLMYPSHVNNAFREMMADLADVNDGTVALTSPTATALDVTNNITVGGTVDGRDVATDGTKLDGIEAAADVTDTTNVTAAGAAMLTGATFNGGITAPNLTANAISLNPTTGYANIEMGGPNGSYIDLKSPFSDDYDGRIITSGTGVSITTGSGSGSVNLQHQNATKLSTTATGISVTGSITAAEATFSGNTSVKLPAGTDAQRPTGVNGMLRYNSDDNQFEGYADGAWGAIAGGGETSFLQYNYTATAGQTTFSGSDDNSATLAYTAANLIVTLNGIVLENSTDYTASNGTSIVLAVAAAVDDELNIVAFKSFTTADMVPASTGGTFSGNVGIGVSPDTSLHVAGVAKASLGFQFGNSYLYEGATDQANMRIGTDGPYLEFIDAGSGVAEVGNASGPLALTASGTERLRIESNGNLQHLSKPAYFARAWVNFKGTGTVSIRESGNVSSVTDLGTGDYRVNFSTAMTDADYSIHFGGTPQNGRFLVNWAGVINNGSNAVVNSTSNCRIAMIDGGSGSRSDSTNNYVSIFR